MLCILFYVYVYAHNSVSHISVSTCVYVLHVCMCEWCVSSFKECGDVQMGGRGLGGFRTPSPISSHGCQEASVRQSSRSDWTIPHPSGHPTLTLIRIVAEHACTQHSQVLHIHNSPVIWFLGCGDGSLNVLQVIPRNCSLHGNLALFPHR